LCLNRFWFDYNGINMSVKLSIYPFFLSGFPCSYRCSYCNSRGSSGVKDEVHAATITTELKNWISKSSDKRDRQVAFYGIEPTILEQCILEALFEAVTPFVSTGQIQGIRLSVRPDRIRLLDRFFNSGIRVIELGIPSMNDHVLSKIQRGHNSISVYDAVRYLRKRRVEIGFQTMIGLPGSDKTEAMETAHRLAALKPDFVRIHPTLVLSDTFLAQEMDKGTYKPITLDHAIDVCADVAGLYGSLGIPVARIGFHIPEDLRDNCLVGGPYHPAFGALVRSEMRYRFMVKAIQKNPGIRSFTVPADQLSDFIGYQRENISKLKKQFNREFRISAIQ
jgi:histone acetyltransferase (RNA polymerase elongator complex component)